jgi:hypothetical protein
MFSNEGFSPLDLFFDLLFLVALVFLVILLVLGLINFIDIDRLFHEFLDSNKLF